MPCWFRGPVQRPSAQCRTCSTSRAPAFPSNSPEAPTPVAACCGPASDDELLVHWRKVATPWMRYPHSTELEAWRDPFFVQLGDNKGGREWVIILCSGIRQVGGSALLYRSHKLTSGGWAGAGAAACCHRC
jgi:hypothetical protein